MPEFFSDGTKTLSQVRTIGLLRTPGENLGGMQDSGRLGLVATGILG